MSCDKLSDFLLKFHHITKKPTKFLTVQDDLSEEIKLLVKSMYDFTQLEEDKSEKHKEVLTELIVDNFDEEQVWQQIELQNNARWDNLIKDVSACVSNKNLTFPIKQHELEKEESDLEGSEAEDDDNDDDDDNVSDSKISENDKIHKVNKHVKKDQHTKPSIVDDQFFKLNEMEKFLDEEDRKEMMDGKVKKQKVESDDESIDLFEASDEDDDSVEDEEKNNDIKYDDFFGESNDDDNHANEENDTDPDENEFDEDDGSDGEDGEISNADGNSNSKKSVRFNLNDSESDDDSEVDIGINSQKNKESKDKKAMSTYELRQQRLREKISKLEEKNLGEKPWQLKGEVGATTRPQNSLLEEVVDFDLTTRPAPIITEETTFKLEDLIRQRIKDKVWDDVERKAKPVPETHEFRKQIILDQEKSKLSLAQVYEQEFLKQKRALTGDEPEDEEEPEEHKKIKTAMKTLFAKLDALSNYHYTPKAAQAEVKIVSNIPAISMEEVAPVATSDAALLAPEEVKGKKKGELMNKTERTSTDKKRERRKKKTLQRERQKEKNKKDNLINKLNPGLGNKYSKEKASKLLDKVSKDFTNTEKMTQLNDAKSLKSSKAFFTQLNDDMRSVKKSKNKKDLLPAKKYKL